MNKIKTIICATATIVLMAACGSKNEFSINGTAASNDFNGEKAYLYNGATLKDSTIIADQHFTFKGTVDEPWMGSVYVTDGNNQYQYHQDLVIEPGQITIDVLENAFGGTPMNDSLNAFMQHNSNQELYLKMMNYMQLYHTATTPEVRTRAEHMIDSLQTIFTQRTFDQSMQLYNANKDNLLGAYGLSNAAQLDMLSYSELNAMLEQSADVVKNYQPLVKKMAQLKAVEETSAGHHYIDLQGVDGKLSDLIDGKVALVDFWASWCGPCRAEIRDNLVPLWAKYKDRGLVIVGLNVWERGDRAAREAAHQKAMNDLGITYPQLVDSTRTATDTYGVQGIPQIMLIAADGTILARDLRGEAIEEAIINALGK